MRPRTEEEGNNRGGGDSVFTRPRREEGTLNVGVEGTGWDGVGGQQVEIFVDDEREFSVLFRAVSCLSSTVARYLIVISRSYLLDIESRQVARPFLRVPRRLSRKTVPCTGKNSRNS